MTAKTKAHFPYKLQNGDRVPSVTTVLGILAKPALLDWAWRMGCEGQDYKKVRDTAGEVGTLAHYLIVCHLQGLDPDVSEYSPQDIDLATNCLLSFLEWEKHHDLQTVLIEQPLISEVFQYGGTVDWFGQLDGVNTLLDFKTGKAIYDEHLHQLAAYVQLIQETQDVKIEQSRILRIGKDEDEGFEERVLVNLDDHWDMFINCRAIYELQRKIRKER